MATHYEPYDGDYIDADYTRLLDDIQTEQDIDIGAWLEICAMLDEDQIHIICSNDEGNEWVYDFTFPIPASWNVDEVRTMFEGNVYLQTDSYQKPENDDEE